MEAMNQRLNVKECVSNDELKQVSINKRATIDFRNDWDGFINAREFKKSFETTYIGKRIGNQGSYKTDQTSMDGWHGEMIIVMMG